jgi:hypothetical protein
MRTRPHFLDVTVTMTAARPFRHTVSPPITRGQASFACSLDLFHADHREDAGCRGAAGSVSEVIPATYIVYTFFRTVENTEHAPLVRTSRISPPESIFR